MGAPEGADSGHISIHALLAESDATDAINGCNSDIISIHALLAESDPPGIDLLNVETLFLSTLSLRRATIQGISTSRKNTYFYPRSPCGERRYLGAGKSCDVHYFYPRSPCGERPMMPSMAAILILFLSTLSLRRATKSNKPAGMELVFLSTLSLRRATSSRIISSSIIIYFYPRSPCGERRGWTLNINGPMKISIHALLAESDISSSKAETVKTSFLSTLSLRRATLTKYHFTLLSYISIHALLAESDMAFRLVLL